MVTLHHLQESSNRGRREQHKKAATQRDSVATAHTKARNGSKVALTRRSYAIGSSSRQGKQLTFLKSVQPSHQKEGQMEFRLFPLSHPLILPWFPAFTSFAQLASRAAFTVSMDR